LYEQLAESTDVVLAQKVLRDIAVEEKVHAGEFLRLLKELQPDEESFYEKGAREVEDEFINKAGESVDTSSSNSGSQGLGIGKLQSRASK
jgi:rubrerythrin